MARLVLLALAAALLAAPAATAAPVTLDLPAPPAQVQQCPPGVQIGPVCIGPIRICAILNNCGVIDV